MSKEYVDWKHLSEAASVEQDPRRLMELVERLNEVLEAQEKLAREGQFSPRSFHS